MLESSAFHFAIIAGVALGAHLVTVLIRGASRRLLESRLHSETKARTVTGFATSVVVFAIYFGAFGFALAELGISLATYLASASVIGLAVSFGSQGVVQDVITGLTLVFSDLLDVGDMVEIGGQVGIVESVGMRFTVLVNFSGARVFVPNRSIASVVSYPRGYVRAYMDVRVPAEAATGIEERLERLARSAYEQYPGILLAPPTMEGRSKAPAGYSFVRIKFRIWPGQGAVLESAVRAAVTQAMKECDPGYADWMVSVHYRSESTSRDPRKRLPRPSALAGGPGAPGATRGSGASDEPPANGPAPGSRIV
jgi:small conductance mechanosensitive channel